MIFGYVSTRRYHEIEEAITRDNPGADSFGFDFEDRQAFFIYFCPNKFSGLSYRSADKLLLCDGMAIRQTPGKGYEPFNEITEQDIQKGLAPFIDTIISNVSAVFLEKEDRGVKITLSSSRGGPGKMYYRSIAGGIAFSTDFTALLKFGQFNWYDAAIYYIIRYGYAPPPVTVCKEIQAVPNACWATFDADGRKASVWPYFRFDFSQSNGTDLGSVENVLNESAEVLNQVGSSLLMSGGIDSTLFASKMRRNSGRDINAYYLRFGENDTQLHFAEQAAEKTGCTLTVFNIEADVIPDTIIEIAGSYPHPFNDYSTIATYYVMKQAGNHEPGGIIFDGNGGDDCFGLNFWLPNLARRQRLFYHMPAFIKALAFNITSNWDLTEKSTGLAMRIIRELSAFNEKGIYQAHLSLCPWTNIFQADTRAYDTELGMQIAGSFADVLKPSRHNESYLARATVAWMRHVTPGMWCAKTYGIKSLPAVQPVYPYMWKDMLIEQGKLSWAAKVNQGIVKWPLKKLLEDYMPKDFIYRDKSGFTPPLESWFDNKKLHELLHDTLFSQHTVIERVVNKENKAFKSPFTKNVTTEGVSL